MFIESNRLSASSLIEKNRPEFFDKVSRFIRAYFQIVQSSLPPSHLPELLSQKKVIVVLGENHFHLKHRYLNGQLINLLFKKESSKILGEGGEECAHDQMSFVNRDFLEKVSSWDKCIPPLNKAIEELVLSISLVKSFLKEFPKIPKTDLIEFAEFVETYLPDYKKEVYGIEEIKNWNVDASDREKIKAFSIIYSKIAQILYSALESQYNEVNRLILQSERAREESLVSRTMHCSESVFVVAGADHVSSARVKEGLKGSTHLIVVPKEDSTIEKVYSYLKEHFKGLFNDSKPIDAILRDVAKTPHIPAITEDVIISLKSRLIRFNVELTGEGQNHFAYWFGIAMDILQWDSTHPFCQTHFIKVEEKIRDDYFKSLKDFIETYFDVIQGSLDFKSLLPRSQVIIGLGDIHLFESDHYLNGLITHLFPAQEMTLYCEGGARSPDDLPYVKNTGVESFETWDISLSPKFFEIVFDMKIALNDVGNFLSDFPTDSHTTFDHISEFADNFINSNHRESVLNLPAIRALKNDPLTERQRFRMVDLAYREISRYYYEILINLDKACNEILKSCNPLRNRNLIRKALETKGVVFLLAGHAHFEEAEVLASFGKAHSLLIKPKRKIDIESVQLFLREHFSEVSLPEFNGFMTKESDTEKAVDQLDARRITSEEIQELKQQLIDLDADEINSRDNHFDLWVQRALLVLEWESL